ncbi:MAG: DUF3592 domain-containing protein [Ruminococcus sp.]|nr:DUF3592 domain-containing protein [Ruminococcus sp.]
MDIYTNNYDYSGEMQPEKTGGGCLNVIIYIIIFLLFASVPLISIGGGAVFYVIINNAPRECIVSVEAEVEDNKVHTRYSHSRKHSGSSRTYRPIYVYEYEGNTYHAGSSFSMSPAVYKIGDKVEILINPDDPTQIYDPEMAEKMSKAPILFIVIGGAVIVVELIAAIVISRKMKKIVKSNSEVIYYNNNF